MSAFCDIATLKNESDVEQKFFWPFLTDKNLGVGFESGEILTKANIKQFTVDKGDAEKLYRPDYIVVLCGLPTIVCEVKRPGENLDEALREARLYASELNSKHPKDVNPCIRVVASDGKRIVSSPWDTATKDFDVSADEISLSHVVYSRLRETLNASILRAASAKLRRRINPSPFTRAIDLIGGEAAKDEEVGYNDFGKRLSIDYVHLFNPQSREHRSHIVRNAYVASTRREHYVDEIDRVIRMALPSPVPGSTLLDNASNPSPLLRILKRGRDLVDKLFLLIGPVGSGKSTFVDYFREVKLPSTLANQLVWITIDLNKARPQDRAKLEEWVVGQLIRELERTRTDINWNDATVIQKMFAQELRKTTELASTLLKPGSDRYNEALFDELQKLLREPTTHAAALARYICGGSKLLVVAFDNCDKGDKPEQLLMFSIVKWLQSWLKCLIFLPLRDVTYYTAKDRPPLDTVIPDFVFRIETPPFTEVLRKRINLALKEMEVEGGR